jgi:hypothetical protein
LLPIYPPLKIVVELKKMDTKKMEPVDVYLMYCALKAHFGKGDYDYITYKGKTKIKRDSFYKRKDRGFFVKIAKKYDNPQDYFISNFIKDRNGYIANFNNDNYQSWKLKRQGFFDEFEVEMQPLVQSFEDLFVIKKRTALVTYHPKLLKEFLGGRVSIETMIILNELVNYSKVWNEKLKDDVIWPDLKKFMNNYKRFLTIDEKRYRMKLLKLIEEST